jgi:hypothetical protein
VRATWLLLLISISPAYADKGRDCYLKEVGKPPSAETATIVPIGCFEKIKATEDHAYGYRACFYLADRVCSGALDVYDGGIEPDRAPFDTVTCNTKNGAVSFTVSRKWRPSYEDVGPFKLELSFTGKIASNALRGTLREGTKGKPVVWSRTKRDANVSETVKLFDAVGRCAG